MLSTKAAVEKLIKFKLDILSDKVDIRVFIFIGITTYLTLASFITFFCFIVIGFRMRFELICRAILNSKNQAAVTEISKLYLQLYESMLKFNKIFPISLELFINFCVFALAFSFYEVYFAIINRAENQQQLGVCVLSNLWNFYLGSTIFAIFSCCASFQRINSSILITLTSQYHLIDDNNTRRRISMFLMQTEHLQPQVLNGVYVLDWKLFIQVRIP